MAPTDLSPTNNRSSTSNSTTPPSETTLADDVIDFEASELGHYLQPAKQFKMISNQNESQVFQQQPQQDQAPSSSMQQQQQQLQQTFHDHRPTAINTDYESSAAEDSEAFTLGKYETAEYALLSYARTNKLDKMLALLEAKARDEISLNLNFKGQQKQNFSWSALHLACYFGHLQVVEQLLSKKGFRDEIDINVKNNSGDTPLHKATLTNRVQIVQFLLSHGANVFIKNCDGLLAKQLTSDKHIFDMLEAAEQADKILFKQNMFKAVDNGDLKRLQEYFHHYNMLTDVPSSRAVLEGDPHEQAARDEVDATNHDETSSNDAQAAPSAQSNCDTNLPTVEYISQMTDERGNTLLHLATMRGFKAICVYLLEQGFDPYRKNDLGQSCIDISSYQLRQLFISVKPASSQLKRLSKERVTRFEGPLMKRVRILGWKQIYVVLENGVILLFNNRKDSMNKARRGYKYLETATCEPDPNDVGLFTVCFSDRSRATFLISSDHINQYASFKSSMTSTGQESGKNLSCNQIELIRQKWIDSMRDHIAYSTEFIRKGLKIDDDDDSDAGNLNDISSLNHLLPMDTIKSFFQEARAHYSILERHSESLCALVQTINSSGALAGNSLETSQRISPTALNTTSTPTEPDNQQQASTGTRLFGFIRGSRLANTSATGGSEEESMNQQQSTLTSSTSRGRSSNSLTKEFLQDSWPCVLFHLRLLVESTENTKTTLGQALALMEHQEQLRQNRIQDQEERCRVLEDSLHALARDHHELEKSLSMSQIYLSPNGCRSSVSMSTDLNEYFDAFEDFDDEKTMTPDSSPGDDDFEKKIQELMGEERDDKRAIASRSRAVAHQSTSQQYGYMVQEAGEMDGEEEEMADEEDDIQSNCSALTVETITDQYLSAADASQLADFGPSRQVQAISLNRTRLPAPMVPRDQVSIWSILKNCIGKELSKITMPVVFNEPLTMLQRSAEGIQYCRFLNMADERDDPVERMEQVCAFIVATISCNCHRIIKPFNPLLYETFEYDHELDDGSHVKGVAQQVSHHPPITAVCCESDNFTFNGVINPKIKFWGRSIEVSHDGMCRVHLKRHNETYLFNSVACSVHNIIVGKLWFEHHGPLDIRCYETNLQANLQFKQAGWFSNDLHRFDGFIVSGGLDSSKTASEIGNKGKRLRFVYGKWSDYIKSVNYTDYENYMRDNQQKLFRIPDHPDQGSANGLVSDLAGMSLSGSPNSVNNNSIPSDQSRGSTSKAKQLQKGGDKRSGTGGSGSLTKSDSAQSLDIPNSRTLWRLEAQCLSEYYSFTLFTMRLNELTPELEKTLPRTDSRFRPDVRKLEEGDLDGAASEKQRLEEKQREARSRDKRFKDPSPDFLFFEQSNVPNTKEKFWLYKGGYWENKCNSSKFPELF